MALVGRKVAIRFKQEADVLDLLGLGMTEIAMTPPLAMLEDNTLIKLVLEGNAECFAVLIDRHLVDVTKRIHRMRRNATDAEDILQEVLLKVWLHLSAFRAESSFRTWLTRIATNEVLQSYRRKRSRAVCPSFGDLDALASPCESQHQSLARVEVTQAVRGAVARLPAMYRQVLTLCDIEQLSVRETARWLQSSIPAVKTRLFRGRRRLLAALRRSGIRGLVSAGV
jgi:RNA polymerase sigma-70 factor (ECF subfamily)